jgi:hypothetical protein
MPVGTVGIRAQGLKPLGSESRLEILWADRPSLGNREESSVMDTGLMRHRVDH